MKSTLKALNVEFRGCEQPFRLDKETQMDANLESVHNLRENLAEHNFDLGRIPYTLQLNKRDLPGAVALQELERELRIKNEPVYEAVATKGTGVFDTLKNIVKQVLTDLKNR